MLPVYYLNIHKHRDHSTDETLEKSGKQDFFNHILERWGNTYKSSGSKIFRTTSGIQSRPDTIKESDCLWPSYAVSD